MVTIFGYLLILTFVLVIFLKKASPFVALILVPVIFGIVFCIASGTSVLQVFDWVSEGLFYKLNKDTVRVTAGTMRSAIMVFFAISYFTLMMQVGLFDPLCLSIMQLVKGDPLKIIVASMLTAAGVALDGDGTTTVLITTAAFMPLYRQFKIKGTYLAVLIAIPCSIFNMSPWGGPLARVLSALNLEANELFPPLIPGMIVAFVYAVFIAYTIGQKERKRLGYDPKAVVELTTEEIAQMNSAILDNEPELKRPKMIWFNFGLTAVIMVVLILGLVNSGLLFMTGLAIALVANFGFNFNVQRKRLEGACSEGAPAAAMIMSSGFFMGIISGSGMGEGIATHIGSMIPASMGSHIPILTSILGVPGMIFLGLDPYIFGIIPVLADVASGFGITALNMGVATMIPLSLFYATPLVAWVFVLCERTDTEFVDYQKALFKYAWPVFIIYTVVAVITGIIPL